MSILMGNRPRLRFGRLNRGSNYRISPTCVATHLIRQKFATRKCVNESKRDREGVTLQGAAQRVLFSGQKLVAMTVDEFVQCGLHGPGQIGCDNSLTIAGNPFLHSVHYELLFGNPHELALSSQPIELDCADHHPEGATGLIRLLGKRCRIIIPHKLDSQQSHRMDSPAPSRVST
jgi:hypothetical protein